MYRKTRFHSIVSVFKVRLTHCRIDENVQLVHQLSHWANTSLVVNTVLSGKSPKINCTTSGVCDLICFKLVYHNNVHVIPVCVSCKEEKPHRRQKFATFVTEHWDTRGANIIRLILSTTVVIFELRALKKSTAFTISEAKYDWIHEFPKGDCGPGCLIDISIS